MAIPDWPVMGTVEVRKVPDKSLFFNVVIGRVSSEGFGGEEREFEVQQTFFGAYVLRDLLTDERFAVFGEDVATAVEMFRAEAR